MKRKYKISVIILVLLAVALTCVYHVRKPLTPEETVALYLKHFNDKNDEQMKMMMAEENRPPLNKDKHKRKARWGTYWDYLEYVKLHSCYEGRVTDRDISASRDICLYENYAYRAKVYTAFEIQFAENAKTTGAFENGMYLWRFHLVKARKSDPWMIADMGY